MNEGIELHDSELSSVSLRDDTAFVSLAPAILHRSGGYPGRDLGTVWLQLATLTVFDAILTPSVPRLPATISGGSLRVGEIVHRNIIPVSGTFEGKVELLVMLITAQTLTIQGQGITIELHETPRFLENFAQ